MPRISKTKEDRIKETILAFLFQQAPQAIFTYHIAQETARDEEYIKKLMLDLEAKGIVSSVKKNPRGIDYTKRIRWRLTDSAYNAYKNLNNPNSDIHNTETPLIPDQAIVEKTEQIEKEQKEQINQKEQ